MKCEAKRTFNKTVSVIAIVISSSFLSCAISKAIYIGSEDYSQRKAPPFPEEVYNAENINGVFPETVYIKTRTQTFNSYHYYILHDNRIWYKSIDNRKGPGDWTLFMKTGLPHSYKIGFQKTNAIVEISADADELMALSVEGNIYSYCFDKTMALRSNVWIDRQGWPAPEQFYFDNRTAKNRSWALGKRNSHVLYYEDIFGNQHHNGTMEISTIYVLLEDGQEICFGDPGLPSDFSRNFTGPERGTFIAASLSASASTMFVINEAGEMYTRLVDFDTLGCDPMFFKYTYIPYKSTLPGTNYLSNLNEWGLPSENWRSQPRIPLAGKAAVTRHITILQNGQGNGARELRVAGLNEEGRRGYWTKRIFDTEWEFKITPIYFTEDKILITAAAGGEDTHGERGTSLDKKYTGYQWNGKERENDWEYQIPDFNILEGDCDFLITWHGETCALKLHPLEMWTYLKRDYLPGRTGSPKIFFVTLEVPENAFELLSDGFIRELNRKFTPYNRKLFQYTITATNNYIIMRNIDAVNSLLFLTDGSVSYRYSEFNSSRYIENYGELRKYYSSDLIINTAAAITMDEIKEKTALNRKFADELKYQIRVLKWSQLTAFTFNAGYLPAHYIVSFTPLRLIDIPKIRTITGFGDKLITENSAYIYTITDALIRLYENIIEMLETRILCYTDLAKNFSYDIDIPPWYSDNISDYWGIAGFPRTIQGTFFSPPAVSPNVKIPASLSFISPNTNDNVSGWFLAIGDSSDFFFYIDPRNGAKTIYSRKGKTPQERKMQIECTLYINDNANAPLEKDVMERTLRRYIIGKNKSINARIIFDGKAFEIREHPSKYENTPIFRGTF
jgi:hypothetical protein